MGTLSTMNGGKTIDTVVTNPGFRRRNVATNLLAQAEKKQGAPIAHSTNRTHYGDAWARKTGGKAAPTSHRESMLASGKKVATPMRKVGSRRVTAASITSRTGVERGKKQISFDARPKPAVPEMPGGFW